MARPIADKFVMRTPEEKERIVLEAIDGDAESGCEITLVETSQTNNSDGYLNFDDKISMKADYSELEMNVCISGSPEEIVLTPGLPTDHCRLSEQSTKRAPIIRAPFATRPQKRGKLNLYLTRGRERRGQNH